MLNDRVKEVRKALGLTMKQFAEPLGLAESTISKIEKGTANPSDAALRLICSVYHVDYFWLTEGDGAMFINDTDIIIEELAKQKGWNSDIEKTLKDMFSLPDDKFNLVMQLIESMSEQEKGKNK